MLLRFLVDADNPNRWGDGTEDEGSGYASSNYINSRLPHEKTTFNELFYDTFRKYCSGVIDTSKTVLIDISDDVMFQFMLEGVEDEDFLVYNPFTEKIIISTNLHEACNEAYRDDSSSNRVYGKQVGSYNNSKDQHILSWDVYDDDDDLDTSSKRKVLITVKDNFYNLVYKELKKYIQHWMTTKMYTATNKLSYTIEKLELDKKYPNGIPNRSVYDHNEPCDPIPENDPNEKMDLSLDGLYFVFMQYLEDGEFYLNSTKYVSKFQFETFRKMYLYLHNCTTETITARS